MIDTKLLSILDLDKTKNLAALGFFSTYPVEEYFIEGNSAIIFGKSDHPWAHISSSSEIELSSLLNKYNSKTKYYFSVEDWMISHILKYGDEDWRMITNRYILDENIETNLPKCETIRIDESYADYIYTNSDYKEYTSVNYIKDRLSKDISAGIMVNDKLTAWGFTHDDGALGFLHVLDEYRKNGYGSDILLKLVEMRKKEKKIIFGNVVPENIASINLLAKLGFKFDRRTNWIKLK